MNNLSFASQMRKKLSQFQADLYSATSLTYLGHPDGTVAVPTRPGWVYVCTDNNQPVQVFNKKAPLIWGLPVTIGIAPEEPNLLQVLSVATVTSQSSESIPYNVGSHAVMHGLLGPDPVFIEKRQMLPSRISPITLTSGSAGVTVYPDIVWVGNQWKSIPYSSIDLNSYIPGSGSSCYVLLSISGSGTINITQGTVTSGLAPDITVAGVLPQIPVNSLAVGFVRLWGGMSAVNESDEYSDILDTRSMLVVGSTPLSDKPPLPLGVAASGSSLVGSREDHVHAHGALAGGNAHSLATSGSAGFMPVLSGSPTQYLNGAGAWSESLDILAVQVFSRR